jgi:acyl-coenzyme A synthetase/AMP-(fatty) acid ligase
LNLIGRHFDIVKIAGRRVSLTEIDIAICAAEGVTDAYVSSRTGRAGELRIVGLYSGSSTPSSIKAELLSSLPEWKLPRILRQVEQINYNARGKKDRETMESVVDSFIDR